MSFRSNQKYRTLNYILAIYLFFNTGLLLFFGGRLEMSGFVISVAVLNVYLGAMILKITPWAYNATATLFFISILIQLKTLNNLDAYGFFTLVLSVAGLGGSIFLKNNVYITQHNESSTS